MRYLDLIWFHFSSTAISVDRTWNQTSSQLYTHQNGMRLVSLTWSPLFSTIMIVPTFATPICNVPILCPPYACWIIWPRSMLKAHILQCTVWYQVWPTAKDLREKFHFHQLIEIEIKRQDTLTFTPKPKWSEISGPDLISIVLNCYVSAHIRDSELAYCHRSPRNISYISWLNLKSNVKPAIHPQHLISQMPKQIAL